MESLCRDGPILSECASSAERPGRTQPCLETSGSIVGADTHVVDGLAFVCLLY